MDKDKIKQLTPPGQFEIRRAVCHRCAGPARRQGRMSASVEGEDGRVRRLFLCRDCIGDLSSWSALYANAEAAEQAEARPSWRDRRAA